MKRDIRSRIHSFIDAFAYVKDGKLTFSNPGTVSLPVTTTDVVPVAGTHCLEGNQQDGDDEIEVTYSLRKVEKSEGNLYAYYTFGGV